MKKTITWAMAGLFALSLQGAALGQVQEKAAESTLPPALESPAPLSPALESGAPEKVQKQTPKKSFLKKKKAGQKKVKKAKKKAV